MPPFPPPSRAIVVLGMHRSGTSAVAGCLQRLGVDFGPRLMPPTPDNVRGFYEHIDIVNLHDRLLLAAGSRWDDPDFQGNGLIAKPPAPRFREELRALLQRDFAAAPLWGLKDPRMCRLLAWWQPLWAELKTEPFYVIVLRDPREIMASLARRDGFSAGKAARLWLAHILEAESATRAAPRLFLDFADFLAGWQQALAPVAGWVGKPWPVAIPDDFVDAALARSRPGQASVRLPAWVEELDTALRVERRTGPELWSLADRISGQVQAARELQGSASERAGDQAAEYETLRRQVQWYEAEWQKARARLERSREQSAKRQKQVESLKNRILAREIVIAGMRKLDVADVRISRGFFVSLFRWFRPK